MKELAKIISVVSRHMDIKGEDVLFGRSFHASRARGVISFILHEGIPHLLKPFVGATAFSYAGIMASAKEAERRIGKDDEFRILVNEIMADLDMPMIKNPQKSGLQPPSHTKVLFGFNYTESDIKRRRDAIRGTIPFMKEMCAIGRQPIPDGMVFSPLRPKMERRKWYNY